MSLHFHPRTIILHFQDSLRMLSIILFILITRSSMKKILIHLCVSMSSDCNWLCDENALENHKLYVLESEKVHFRFSSFSGRFRLLIRGGLSQKYF